MRILFLLVSFILIRAEAIALDPQFSQYMFLKQFMNPGYVGTSQVLSAAGVYRNQWVGFSGAPKTFLFCAEAPVKALHGGVGITLMNDKIGNFNFTKAGAAYSYQTPLGKTGLLGIGLEGEMVHAVIRNNWLWPSGSVAPIVEDSESTTYNIGLGAYYETQKLYIGISSAHLLTGENHPFQVFNYRPARHYYLMAGYSILFSSWGKVVPSVLFKGAGSSRAIDANLTLYWRDMIWAGASYRSRNTIVAMAGFDWALSSKLTLRLGYSYHVGISKLGIFHNDTHEFLLSCHINIPNKSE